MTGDHALEQGIAYWRERVPAELHNAGRRLLWDLEEWDNARLVVSVALTLAEGGPLEKQLGQRQQRGMVKELTPCSALSMVVVVANEQVLPWGKWQGSISEQDLVTELVAIVRDRVIGLFYEERYVAVAALGRAGGWEQLGAWIRPWHEAAVRDLGHDIPQQIIDDVRRAAEQGAGLAWARTGERDWVLYTVGRGSAPGSNEGEGT